MSAEVFVEWKDRFDKEMGWGRVSTPLSLYLRSKGCTWFIIHSCTWFIIHMLQATVL